MVDSLINIPNTVFAYTKLQIINHAKTKYLYEFYA